jgi:hypothetical protein
VVYRLVQYISYLKISKRPETRRRWATTVSQLRFRACQVNQKGLELNGTRLQVYADDVNTTCENITTTEKNKQALLHTTSEGDIELNSEKTKYMGRSQWPSGLRHVLSSAARILEA